MFTIKGYLHGEWVECSDGKKFNVFNFKGKWYATDEVFVELEASHQRRPPKYIIHRLIPVPKEYKKHGTLETFLPSSLGFKMT